MKKVNRLKKDKGEGFGLGEIILMIIMIIIAVYGFFSQIYVAFVWIIRSLKELFVSKKRWIRIAVVIIVSLFLTALIFWIILFSPI